MARKTDPNAIKTRRPRTTSIQVVVPTTLKAVGEYLGVHTATISARYHRIQDAYPRRVVTLEALAESHRGKTI